MFDANDQLDKIKYFIMLWCEYTSIDLMGLSHKPGSLMGHDFNSHHLARQKTSECVRRSPYRVAGLEQALWVM